MKLKRTGEGSKGGVAGAVEMDAAKTKLLLLACLVLASVEPGRCGRQVAAGGSTSFNVMKFGAKGDGKSDDTQSFAKMWSAACAAAGDVKIVVPKRSFLIGPVQFKGPCPNARSVSFDLQGYLKASTNLNKYGDDWVQFGWIDRLTLTGGGTFDGQGSASWRFNTCPMNKNCKILPISIKFVHNRDTVVRGITSLNSKFFHIALLDCTNFQASGIRISAPESSPNTDGIHIERCSGVKISGSTIGTGDDCVSIGHGNSQISISGITCGPGHGISVGSLGRYSYEKDVNGLVVKDSMLIGTMNGLRIKTWADSPGSITATNMTFENIVMNNVANPIIIDQTYCPYKFCASSVSSRVRISNVSFKNIRGTSSTPVAVTLECSKGAPCQNINLHDVHLDYAGGKKATSACQNARVRYTGTQIPPPCVTR